MFRGRYLHTIDPKGRVSIPARFRDALGESYGGRLVVVPNEHCLEVHPLEEWQRIEAKLRELSNAADPASRTFEARYVLEGKAASAPLGSTVTITLVTKPTSGNHPVLVPIGAIYDRGSGPGVWIVNDKSEVKFRSVKIAPIGKEEVVVSRGVQAGEKVVALGAHLLREGQVVNLAKEEKVSDAKF